MLDDIERRGFLVQPPRKNALPVAAGLFDVELDESAGEAFVFPWGGRVACAQADHGVAQADRLPGLQGQVADDAVALVEQADHRDALGHRGHARHRFDRARRIDRHRIGAIGRLASVAGVTLAARDERQQQAQRNKAGTRNYSGFHA